MLAENIFGAPMNDVEFSVLEPKDTRQLEPTCPIDVWVYKYTDQTTGWTFSIGTHGEPHSNKLSLGGFRIAPANRVSMPGYSNDREAIGLAIGMEEKVYWSRLITVGGPIGIKNLNRVVGGKCVLMPTPGARVGEPQDFALLDFAIACFRHFEETSGVLITTGQDLGHGMMSDGKTPSLGYLNAHFHGSILSDTSQPTAEGNFYMVRGALRGLGLALKDSRLGLIGCGNIGRHLLSRFMADGAECVVVEGNPSRVAELKALGVKVYSPEEKAQFLAEPIDALSLNANGGSLDMTSIDLICKNPRLKFVGGCENLVMPDPHGATVLKEARKIYCHTELCGMMGYLTAVEEYLSKREGVTYDMKSMFKAAEKLEEAGFKATQHLIEKSYTLSFEDAMRAVYKAS
jgi:hypothetical protein